MSDANDFDTRIAAARTMYEGTHGLTMAELSAISGIPKRQLTIYQRDQNWQKRLETKHGGATDEALEARAMLEGQAKTQAEQSAAVVDAAGELTDPLPTEHEALLARHKKELNVPRALMQQGINLSGAGNAMQAFEKLKQAKISAETLTLIHNAERKAHGIDKPDGNHTVVLERGASV